MLGNAMLDKILAALNIAGVLTSLGLLYYVNFVFKKPLPQEEVEKALLVEDTKKNTQITPFKFKKITINIPGNTSRLRFLDVEINALPFKEEDLAMVEKNTPLIIDTLIALASDMGPDDLNSVSGKILLESRLKRKVNQKWNRQVIRQFYFSVFVVQ